MSLRNQLGDAPVPPQVCTGMGNMSTQLITGAHQIAVAGPTALRAAKDAARGLVVVAALGTGGTGPAFLGPDDFKLAGRLIPNLAGLLAVLPLQSADSPAQHRQVRVSRQPVALTLRLCPTALSGGVRPGASAMPVGWLSTSVVTCACSHSRITPQMILWLTPA